MEEDRGRTTDDGVQRTDDGHKIEDRWRKTEDGWQAPFGDSERLRKYLDYKRTLAENKRVKFDVLRSDNGEG